MGFLYRFVECVVVEGLRIGEVGDEFVRVVIVGGQKLSVRGDGWEVSLHWLVLVGILQRGEYIRSACCQ